MNIAPSCNSEVDSNLSFAEMAEKYKWDFTPLSQRSRGALTQDAALGLLDMIKPEDQRAQMAARMEVAMRRVGCEIIMDGDKELPRKIDEARAGDVVVDNDNMIEEITEETMTEQPTSTATATTDIQTIDLALDEPPTRPARVKRKKRSTKKNNNNDRTTNTPKSIQRRSNHFNTFGEKGEEYALAETVTRKYSKMKNSTHNRFLKIVREATDPTTNNPGDAVLHEMFTNEVRMKKHLEVDYLFYYNVSSRPNMHKRTILDQALKIWTTRIANAKDGKPLNTTTHGVYVRHRESVVF
eukprot:jgi/Psemu1/24958/gm1.24958_g